MEGLQRAIANTPNFSAAAGGFGTSGNYDPEIFEVRRVNSPETRETSFTTWDQPAEIAQQLLVRSAARFHVGYGDERLRTHPN